MDVDLHLIVDAVVVANGFLPFSRRVTNEVQAVLLLYLFSVQNDVI